MVIDIYGYSSSAISTATSELIRSAVQDGSLVSKIAGVKLSVLSVSGDLLKIKIAYDSGDADSVGKAVLGAIGGAILSGPGIALGRLGGALTPLPGGSILGGVAGGAAGSAVGGLAGEYVWQQIIGDRPRLFANIPML